jgi:DNA-binding LacI/PurR family transcriptional regulator
LKINQKYIADLLNVSRVTVTKALQDNPDIAEDTKKRVKDLAEQLGYIPNGIGRSLSTKRTRTIGLIIPKINHSFFSTIIEELYKTASDHNYKILLMVSFENEEIEYEEVKTLLSMNVDGIIIDPASSTYSDRSYTLIEKHHKPLLFFDRSLRTFESHGVFFDDVKLSYQMIHELIRRGYKKLAYITGPQHINICYDRFQGFKDATNDFKIEVPKKFILKSGLGRINGYETFRLFLQTNESLPEVVSCVNDSVAFGVYDACEEFGIRIPEDLAVTGFGNLRIAKLVTPPLATVELAIEYACTQVIKNLINIIESEEAEASSEIISGSLVMRESVKESM